PAASGVSFVQEFGVSSNQFRRVIVDGDVVVGLGEIRPGSSGLSPSGDNLITIGGNLTVRAGAKFSIDQDAGNHTSRVDGNVTVERVGTTNGELILDAGSNETNTLEVRGNYNLQGALTSSGNNDVIRLAGSALQTVQHRADPAAHFRSLIITNPVGIRAASDLTLHPNGTLTLSGGTVDMDTTYTLYVQNNTAATVITRTSGYVIGRLRWNLSSVTTGNALFPVGTAAGYRPIMIQNPNPADVTVRAAGQPTNTGGLPITESTGPGTPPAIVLDNLGAYSWELTVHSGTGNRIFRVPVSNLPGVSQPTRVRILTRFGTTAPWQLIGTTTSTVDGFGVTSIAANGVGLAPSMTLALASNGVENPLGTYVNQPPAVANAPRSRPTTLTANSLATLQALRSGFPFINSSNSGTLLLGRVQATAASGDVFRDPDGPAPVITATITSNPGNVITAATISGNNTAGWVLTVSWVPGYFNMQLTYDAATNTWTAVETGPAPEITLTASDGAGNSVSAVLRVWVMRDNRPIVRLNAFPQLFLREKRDPIARPDYLAANTQFVTPFYQDPDGVGVRFDIYPRNYGTDIAVVSTTAQLQAGQIIFRTNTVGNYNFNVLAFDSGWDLVYNSGFDAAGNVVAPNANFLNDDSRDVQPLIVVVQQATAAEAEAIEVPKEVVLEQNYPNPFNPATQIRFGLPQATEVTLEVYNVLGQRVATLVSGQTLKAGYHTVNFEAAGLPSGTYLYRLVAGDKVLVRKMTLLK
ncbi:MAG: T9SS type A sorting domain-containing protein, partial [Bacteroidetes bacterium]|nr:T9SS type A sorting domain-containing protein [Bacteroidota bacterium]